MPKGLLRYRNDGIFASPARRELAAKPEDWPWATSGTGDASFTGQNSDAVSSLYDFTFRRLSPSQGRWISPDPAGLAAVDPTNPQTWNRYAYVANNPLSFIDPLGLQVMGPPGTPGGPNGGPNGDSYNPFDPGQNDSWMEALPEYISDMTWEDGSSWSLLLAFGGGFPLGGNAGNGDGTPNNGPQQQNACTQPILNAIGNQFGTGTYNVTNTFPQGGGTDLQITATDLSSSQFNAFQTGRYPLNWWAYIIGYGPTLHVTGATFSDPNAYFSNSNIGGVTSVDFTAHIDTAFAYNPIGFLIHLFRDMLHLGGPRNPCP